MKEVKFEDNINELEQIINELESGSFDLDESITKYTRAMQLVKECDQKLKSVEAQVSRIVTENGSLENFSIDNDKN
jgi:exodeoxyribonuclease VII small subunit